MRYLLLGALLFSSQGCASDKEVSPGLSVQGLINQHLTAFHEAHPGTSVSVALMHGATRVQAHFGTAPNAHPADNDSLYEIGSLTKTYTGILLAHSVHEGKLALDAPVQQYLPAGQYGNLFRRGKSLTIRDLAAHTGGLPVNLRCHQPELSVSARFACYQQFDKPSFMLALKHVTLLDTPGQRYRYSNAGIRLLSYLIEQQWDKPFDELLQEVVFSRTTESNTLFRLADKPDARLIQGLDERLAPMPAASEVYGGAGGLKSSTSSMLKLMDWYLSSDDPLAQQTMQLLAGSGRTLGRAYVWNTFEYQSERPMLYHAGGTFGTSSWIALYPAQQLGIFMVINKVTPQMQDALNQVANRIVDDVLSQ